MQVRVLIPQFANMLSEMAGRVGMGTEMGQALHKAAGILARAVPAESIPQGAEVAQMQRLEQQRRQNAANVAAMRGAGGAGQGNPAVPRPPNMPGTPGVPTASVPMAA